MMVWSNQHRVDHGELPGGHNCCGLIERNCAPPCCHLKGPPGSSGPLTRANATGSAPRPAGATGTVPLPSPTVRSVTNGPKQPTSGDCVGHGWQQLPGLNRTTCSPPPVAARDLLDRTEAADLFDRRTAILEYDASLPRAEAEIAAAELLAGVAAVAAAGLV